MVVYGVVRFWAVNKVVRVQPSPYLLGHEFRVVGPQWISLAHAKAAFVRACFCLWVEMGPIPCCIVMNPVPAKRVVDRARLVGHK